MQKNRFHCFRVQNVSLPKLRPHFFDLLDYVTCRSEKLEFQKKKKKRRIWRSSGDKRNYDDYTHEQNVNLSFNI